jgi:glucans biosynthesis protein C
VSGAARSSAERVHYLDTLKIAVVYGILLYHAALPFTLTSWLLSNVQKSLILTAFTAFCFPWGIPMMFLLAGADSWFALRSRSALAFLRARFLRLVLPLGAGIILLSPLQWYLTTVGSQRSLSSLLQSYPVYYRSIRLSWTPEWLGRYGYHLWFLGYLFAISAVLLPVLVLLRRPVSRRAIEATAALCRREGAIYVFALPLIASQIALRERFPAYQDWADIATYTLVFLAGYVLASERLLEHGIRSGVRPALAVGTLSTAGIGGFIWLASSGRFDTSGIHALLQVTYSTLWALMIWSWIVVVLYAGIRWLDFGNRVTAYLSESILPFYVLHHPVVVLVASAVIALPLGVWPKYGLVVGISLPAALAMYELLVRRWRPTRFAFGLKPLSRTRTWSPEGTGTPPTARYGETT